MRNKLIARFAPSPTGYLHIGGARTCLFSWLHARSNHGEFILRIEDTDRNRSQQEYLDEIIESLQWLGLDWDRLFYQSQRFDIYREYATKLIREGKAYEKDKAVFFIYNIRRIEIDDLIRGRIVFEELPKKEEVIIKSDGSPTYNFSCVIDDALMGVNCVIRGEDHISNTPKQILMYEALNFEIPEFAHVPLILSPQGGRMSKRFGATSIREYREWGYLAPAIVNYLLLLGWSPGKDREIISLEEAKRIFDIKSVNKTASVFSIEKLNWVNSQYIKNTPTDTLTQITKNFLKNKGFIEDIDDEYLSRIVELFKSRLNTLNDIIEWGRFCFYDDYTYAEDTKEILSRDLSDAVEELIKCIDTLEIFDEHTIEVSFRNLAAQLGLKARDLVHPVRVALTGRKVGPGLFETMAVLGKERVVRRLKRLVDYWRSK